MLQPQLCSRNLDSVVEVVRKLFQKHVKLLRWTSEAESILDIGIGDGKVTNEVIMPLIPVKIKEYIGGDISEVMLQSAENTVTHKKFRTFKIDVTTDLLPNEMMNRFDHVFANYVFHRIQDIRSTLENIKHMLKPGGQLFFNTLARTFNDDVYDWLDEGRWGKYDNRKYRSPFHSFHSPVDEYEKLILEIGYIECTFHLETVRTLHPEKSLDEYLIALNALHAVVKREDEEEYYRDYISACKETNQVNEVEEDRNGEKIFEMVLDVITGVVTKPP